MPAQVAFRLPSRPFAALGRHRPPLLDRSHTELRARVVADIAAQAHDPELTPARLAADQGISLRTLNRLFEHGPMSVTCHIAHAHLDLALGLLRDPRLAHRPVDDVATLAGYASASALHRAVVKATGLTPEAYRARVLDGPLPRA
ncbi:MAG: AraC family transcriptional regulator [Promicromonosporaceae bacterium]|nr:AraC family transcriptional regulator [Promicromonosporaceae bacterium]